MKLFLVLLMLTIAACGQRGALYFPQQKAEAEEPARQDATTGEADDLETDQQQSDGEPDGTLPVP